MDTFVLPKFNSNYHGEPSFEEFKKYLTTKIVYPKRAERRLIEGRVLLSFCIDRYGTVVDVTVVESTHRLFNAEAVRVVKSSPKWTPSYNLRGNPVKTKFVIPLTFNLP